MQTATVEPSPETLTCATDGCGNTWERTRKGGRRPKYCPQKCKKSRRARTPRIEAGEQQEEPLSTPELYEGLGQLDHWVESRVAHFRLNQGLPLLPVQYDVFNCDAPLIGCFGSYRSGKTRAGALKMLQIGAENPWRKIYNRNNPTSVAITETLRVVRDSSYREFMDLVPSGIILKTWESPQNFRVRIKNGHDFIFRQWKGKVEGLSGICTWLDESQKLDGPDGPHALWRNFVMRSSDPRARRRCTIATGLPEYGWLSEIFDTPNTADRVTFLCSLRDNQYLTPDVIRSLYASTTKEEAEVVIEGKWRKPETVVYYAFAFDQNTTDWEGDPSMPAHLTMDLGDKGAILVGQNVSVWCVYPDGTRRREKGLVIVDEILPEKKTAREALIEMKATRPWYFDSTSRITIDPKAASDQISSIREVLNAGNPGGPRLRRARPDEDIYYVEAGHRCVNAAFRDYNGNTRLFISNRLPRSKRSLIPALLAHKRRQNGKPYRDNIVDHVLDALRYLVVDQIPHHDTGWTKVGKAA